MDHVPLHEYYVAQISKGPSMMAEKLDCPMEAAAHERQFKTAQLGLAASNFHDDHCSMVTQTLNHFESMLLNSSSMMQESTYSRPSTPVNTEGSVHYLSDLIWQANDWTATTNTLNPGLIMEADLKDSDDDAAICELDLTETRLLLEQTRARRKLQYRQTSSDLRVNKQITGRNAGAVHLRSKPSDSVRNLTRSVPEP